jgi:metacaspase-1
MRVLCVHGVGQHQPGELYWQTAWRQAVAKALGDDAQVEFCLHDDLFVDAGLTGRDLLTAIQTLGGGYLQSMFRRRGLFDGDNALGWTAGMVTQWVGNETLRTWACRRLRDRVTDVQPDIVLAHSLGSLIAYDLFKQHPALVQNRAFVSFGSQINNPGLATVFRGVTPLPINALWVHLFNPHDHVFTREIRLDKQGAANFRQLTVPHGAGWLGNWLDSHTNVMKYLNDAEANQAWPLIRSWLGQAGPRSRTTTTKALAAVPAAAKAAAAVVEPPPAPRHPRRALLIGVNDYVSGKVTPLAGCVNDVFLVSAALQELGFAPDDIRERLEWLFEGLSDEPHEEDFRFLYFSGHGVRLPVYNADGRPDRLLEALVPSDFDGSAETAITDRELTAYFEGLSHQTRLILAFDCCHAGGLSRSGAGSGTVRSVDLPDDIRHRMLQWNADEEMWVLRDFVPLIPGRGANAQAGQKVPEETDRTTTEDYVGQLRITERLGRDVQSHLLPAGEYEALRKETGWRGAYLPMIIEACREDEFAYEYQHGQVSYGAFTFALCHVLRRAGQQGSSLSYQQLVDQTGQKLTRLGYRQAPGLVGPTKVRDEPIPFAPRAHAQPPAALPPADKKPPAGKKPPKKTAPKKKGLIRGTRT